MQLLADALRPWREKCPEVRVVEGVRLFTPPHALVQRARERRAGSRGPGSEEEPGPVARALLREAMYPVALMPS